MFCDWLDVISEKLIGNRSCKQKQKRLRSEPPAVSKIAMFLRFRCNMAHSFTQPKMKDPGGCETSKVANTLPILPSLHNRTHSKVEAWGRWSARPKICLIVTISLQQSG